MAMPGSYLSMAAMLMTGALLCGCTKDELPRPAPANRTLLVYMAADNNLSGDAGANLDDLVAGMRTVPGNTRTIVYLDTPQDSPRLLEVTGDGAKEVYRDIWFFMYLCNSINTADLVRLKYKNTVDGEICFVRQKTERTTKTIKEIRAVVTPEMETIIERWGNERQPNNFIFPCITGDEDALTQKKKTKDFTKRINKRMKMIGEALGIDGISTYTARHSFATVLKRSGANIAYISESLGHNDLKTTESYLASFEKEERQKNAALLTNFSEKMCIDL